MWAWTIVFHWKIFSCKQWDVDYLLQMARCPCRLASALCRLARSPRLRTTCCPRTWPDVLWSWLLPCGKRLRTTCPRTWLDVLWSWLLSCGKRDLVVFDYPVLVIQQKWLWLFFYRPGGLFCQNSNSETAWNTNIHSPHNPDQVIFTYQAEALNMVFEILGNYSLKDL